MKCRVTVCSGRGAADVRKTRLRPLAVVIAPRGLRHRLFAAPAGPLGLSLVSLSCAVPFSAKLARYALIYRGNLQVMRKFTTQPIDFNEWRTCRLWGLDLQDMRSKPRGLYAPISCRTPSITSIILVFAQFGLLTRFQPCSLVPPNEKTPTGEGGR